MENKTHTVNKIINKQQKNLSLKAKKSWKNLNKCKEICFIEKVRTLIRIFKWLINNNYDW